MGLFRSDYRHVPRLFSDEGSAKTIPGDAAATDARVAHNRNNHLKRKRANELADRKRKDKEKKARKKEEKEAKKGRKIP